MTGVRISLVLSFAQQGAGTIISLVSIMVLARLLTPEDIGIFSVAAAATAFAQVLRDFGVGNYLVQEKDLTAERIQAAFVITLLTAWLAGALIGLGAPLIADFYDQPELTEVFWVLALTFLLIPWAAPRLALLRRDMAFAALFRIRVGAAIVGPIVSITMAAWGYGAMSLAMGSVATGIATVALTLWYGPRRVPMGLGTSEWGRVFGFGIRASASAFITQTGMNSADLIIGRVLGFAALGLYSRAFGLLNLFNQRVMSAIASVAFPAFAALGRARGNAEAAYLNACGLITGVAWPFFAFLGLMAYPVIRGMFGDQWDDAVPLARILAVGGFIYHSLPLAAPVLISTGRIELMLRAESLIQAGRIVLIILGALHSLEAVCVAQVVAYGLHVFIYRHYVLPLLDTSYLKVLRATLRSAMLTVCTMIGPILVTVALGLEPENPWLSLLLAGGLAALGWLAGAFAIRHPLWHELALGYGKARGLVPARDG